MDNIEFLKACNNGDIEKVKLFKGNLDCENLQETGLIVASINGHTEVVNYLLKNGANIDYQNCAGETVLMKVVMIDYFDMVNFLIKKNANIDLVNDIGKTALMMSIYDGFTSIARLLIESGASINRQDKNGTTALIIASFEGHEDIVRLLKNADLNLQDCDGETALYSTAYNNCKDVTKILINIGADLDIQNTLGKTTLMHAVDQNKYEIIELLHNANADIKDIYNRTAFDYAKTKSDYISMILLKKDLINAQDDSGNTFFMRACSLQDERSIMFLIEQEGADFDIKNKYGETAIDILNNHDELSDYLQSLKEKLVLEKDLSSEYEDCPHGL